MNNHLTTLVYFLCATLVLTMGVGFYYKYELRSIQRHHKYCDVTAEKPVVRLLEEAQEQVSYLTRELNAQKELNVSKNPDVDYYKKPGCYWLEAVVEKRPYPENVTLSVYTTVIYLRQGPEQRLGEFSHIAYAKKFMEDNSFHECSP
jgi:hypothetical protein